MHRSVTALALIFALGAAGHAAPPEVKATATSPESPATLAPQQSLYVRVEYQSDQPLRLQASGYLRGIKGERFMVNASPAYAAGTGEALVWLAGDPGARIDEIRVLVHDQNWKLLTTVSVPVQAAWHAGITGTEPAAWVKPLNDAQQHPVGQDLKKSSGIVRGLWSFFASGFVALAFLSVPGYPILQVYAFYRLRGPRRLLSALPLSFMLPTYAFCLYALSRDSNLWPLYAIFLSPVAFLIVGGMLLYDRRRPAPPPLSKAGP